MSSDADTHRLVKCPKCAATNRVPLSAKTANCGICNTPLALKPGSAEVRDPACESPDSIVAGDNSVVGVEAPSGAPAERFVDPPQSNVSDADVQASAERTKVPTHTSIRVEQVKGSNAGVAWILAAVVGAAAISVSYNSSSGIVRLSTPCAIMLVYFAWGWNQQSRNSEKLADSLYFLGFIWTLYALIHSLVASENVTPNASSLFTTFGYALVTTGLGMFLRMVVIQLEYSAPEQLRDARNELAEGLDQFRVRMIDAQQALAASRKEIQRTTEAWMTSSKEMSQSMLSASRDTVEQARAAVQQLVKGLSDTGEAVNISTESTKAASRALGRLSKSVVTASEKLSETLERASDEALTGLQGAARKLSGVELPENTLSVHLQRLASDMTAPSREVLRTIGDMSGSLESVVAKLTAVELPPNTMSKQLEQLAEDMIQPGRKLLEAIGDMSAAASAAQDRLSKSAEYAANRINEVANAIDAARSSMGALDASSQAANRSLSGTEKEVSGWSASTAQLVQAQAGLTNSVAALEARLRSVSEQLERLHSESAPNRGMKFFRRGR